MKKAPAVPFQKSTPSPLRRACKEAEEPSTVDVLPDATEVQMDLILANQQTIMTNRHKLQVNQHALKRRMDRMVNLLLQMLKAL